MKKIFTIILIAAVALTMAAQGNRTKWGQEMLEAKHKMIIETVGLSPSQQEQFMPVYQEMEREIYQTNRDARTLASEVEKKKSPTDSEYAQAAEALSRAKVREGEIEAKYFEKFSKMLNKRQLFLLKQAESKFTRTMLRGRKK
ncbi:MAG: hypothetical protein IJ775_03595 [Muribaculaceae bacterium]|nr:hypothetical protein [Muribaculaceae bacterium]